MSKFNIPTSRASSSLGSIFLSLPQATQDFLRSCPTPGAGVNNWLYRAALQLRRSGVEDDSVLYALLARSSTRPEKGDEIRRAVLRSRAALAGGFVDVTPVWPELDGERIAQIVADGYAPAAVTDRNPVQDPALILPGLFREGEWVCVGDDRHKAYTRRLEDLLKRPDRLAAMTFVVPNPFVSQYGQTTDGRETERSASQVLLPRRHVVVEFDNGDQDSQFARHAHLSQYARLVLVVSSGGKSLHGWYATDGADEQTQRAFFERAVIIGADPRTWTLCQYVRLPGVWRPDKGRRQTVKLWRGEQ